MSATSDAWPIYLPTSQAKPLDAIVSHVARGGVYTIANVGERATLLTALAGAGQPPPSATAPVVVFRGDAAAGHEYEYTRDGATWRPMTPATIAGTYMRTANQSIPNNVSTTVIGTASYGVEGGLVLNTSTGEVTIPAGGGGLYLLNGWATFLPNATGSRTAAWWRGATRPARLSSIPHATIAGSTICTKAYRLAAGDVMTFQVLQASGGALDIDWQQTGYELTRLAE